jgi:hypothetical protein
MTASAAKPDCLEKPGVQHLFEQTARGAYNEGETLPGLGRD